MPRPNSGRDKPVREMYVEEASLTVREDAVDNLIGRREGRDPEAPTVLTGSHVDSVPNGGDFDGPLGVLAAVEALQVMQENGVASERAVEAVAFTYEEGARFGLGMTGSRATAGTLDRRRPRPRGRGRRVRGGGNAKLGPRS